jgi:hypothetical protein
MITSTTITTSEIANHTKALEFTRSPSDLYAKHARPARIWSQFATRSTSPATQITIASETAIKRQVD